MEQVVLIATIVALVVGVVAVRGARSRSRTADARVRLGGTRVDGEVIAVLQRSAFDRDRGQVNAAVRLRYRPSPSAPPVEVPVELDNGTPGVPDRIAGPGLGRTNPGGILRRHREAQAYRASLLAQGYSVEQAQAAIVARSVELGGDDARTVDRWVMLTPPEPVSVHIGSQGDGRERLVVVFDRSPAPPAFDPR